jgi:DNA-directed RNA polymerase specialized sigma24 family protein
MPISVFDKTSSKIKPETLFKEHYSRLCHFAYTLLNKKELVEDIVQDAFIAYWNNEATVADHPVAIKNYLYTITSGRRN